jgi:hypothetical protein
MSQSNLPYIAISSAVALALAGSNYNQVSQYLATQGETQSVANCPVFNLSSFGDPHIGTNIDGQTTDSYSDHGVQNLSTIENTDGGATKISTTVEFDPYYNAYTNQTVSQTHSGTGAWSLTATQSANGGIAIAVTDASGLHALSPGQSIMEGDGSRITVTGVGTAEVLQQLSWGGVVETTYQSDGDTPNLASYSGVSVYEQGNGEAIINGVAARQATGSNAAFLPCFVPVNQSSGSGSGSASGNSPATSYTPAEQISM